MLPSIHHASSEQTAAVHPDLTLYVSLELSRSTWLVTCLLPESDRMSKYSTPGGDGCALLGLLERMQARAQQLTGRPVKMVVIKVTATAPRRSIPPTRSHTSRPRQTTPCRSRNLDCGWGRRPLLSDQ